MELFNRNLFLFVLCNLLTYWASAQQNEIYPIADKAKLESIPVKWQAYWNSHDMDSMATLLTADVDFVNVGGVWLKGRQSVLADHKQKHQGVVFGKSHWTNDSLSIRYVRPDIAIIHLGWGVTGDNDPDGTPRKPRHGLFVWMLIRLQGDWKIFTSQNTNFRDPPAVLTNH